MPAQTASFVFFGSDEGAAATAAAAAFARLEEGSDGWGNETIDGSAAPVLRIMTRGEEDTTAIDSAVLNVQPSSVIYDLLGRRVEKMDKGIYIVNGRKVVAK